MKNLFESFRAFIDEAKEEDIEKKYNLVPGEHTDGKMYKHYKF